MGDVKGTQNQYAFYNFMAVKKTPFLLRHVNLVPSEVACTSNFYSKLVYVCNTNDMPTYSDVTSDFSTVCP